MALEIEDKFLVSNDVWRELPAKTTHITQSYLLTSRAVTLRTRIETGKPAVLCIKLKERAGGTPEFEWHMPMWFARLCSKWQARTLRKNRHRIAWGELTIEVDEFLDRHAGLVIAEVELPRRNYYYLKPDWFRKDVSKDSRYKNARLVKDGVPTEY